MPLLVMDQEYQVRRMLPTSKPLSSFLQQWSEVVYLIDRYPTTHRRLKPFKAKDKHFIGKVVPSAFT